MTALPTEPYEKYVCGRGISRHGWLQDRDAKPASTTA